MPRGKPHVPPPDQFAFALDFAEPEPTRPWMTPEQRYLAELPILEHAAKRSEIEDELRALPKYAQSAWPSWMALAQAMGSDVEAKLLRWARERLEGQGRRS